jgi:hypothetical protein
MYAIPEKYRMYGESKYRDSNHLRRFATRLLQLQFLLNINNDIGSFSPFI